MLWMASLGRRARCACGRHSRAPGTRCRTLAGRRGRTMDGFTPPGGRKRLEEEWGAFLASGGAEGWYQLYVPDRGPVPVEFTTWAPVVVEGAGRLRLTEREREVMTLVASGLQGGDIAERLFLPRDGQVPCSQRFVQARSTHPRTRCSNRFGHRSDHLGGIAGDAVVRGPEGAGAS